MLTGNNQKGIGTINVTPLIDVLLVLLIIFMVITPTRPVGLAAAVPQIQQNQPKNPGPDRTIVVQIDKNLQITINSEPIGLERLGSRLSEIFRSRAERVAFVKADGEVEFGHVARAIDIIKGAGIDTIGLLGNRS